MGATGFHEKHLKILIQTLLEISRTKAQSYMTFFRLRRALPATLVLSVFAATSVLALAHVAFPNKIARGNPARSFVRQTTAMQSAAALAIAGDGAPDSQPNAQQPNAPQQNSIPAGKNPNQQAPNHALSYYHYMLAHSYEELMATYGRPELAEKVIQEYRLAIDADPTSEYLNSALAEFYASTNRIGEAVVHAQSIIKRDPANLEARKLLGRIYLRSLGDMQSSTQSLEILRLAIEQFEQIVKAEPQEIDDHILLGRLYALNKDLTKAQNEFKAALKIDPTSEDAVTNLAYLYNEEGDSTRAVAILNSIPDPARSAKLLAVIGSTYEQQKEYRKAITAYRQAITQDHDNLDAVRGLAQNLLNDGQMEAALDQYKALAQADPSDAQIHLHMAEIYRRMGKFDLAQASLKKAESLVQDSLEIPYNQALIYEAQGKYDDAAQALQQILDKTAKPDGNYAVSEKNNRAVFLERLGAIYRETGKTPQALATFRKVVALGDDNAARGYQQLIDTYRDAKQWKDAMATAQEALAKMPNDRGLKLAVASQMADSGQGDAALAQVKAMMKSPADREMLLALAQMESRLKHWKEAEDYIARADKLSAKPEDKDYAAFIAGSIFERQKKYDLAEKMFRRVLANDPHNPMALNYLGYMLADRGVRLDEALGYIKRAIEIDPQNGAYLDSLGWAYFKLGRYDLAEENLARAAEKIRNDATVHDHLGDLYARTGRTRLAASNWQRALEEWARSVPADVDTTDVARVQKKLETARIRLAQKAPAR